MHKHCHSLIPEAITRRRTIHLNARLDLALVGTTRLRTVAAIVDRFRDWLTKVDIRERLKQRYRIDQILFEDHVPPDLFRWQLGRHLRYSLDLGEFERNAATEIVCPRDSPRASIPGTSTANPRWRVKKARSGERTRALDEFIRTPTGPYSATYGNNAMNRARLIA